MASPFPGMDPFLEVPAFWSDFHYTFINYWREAIADALPPNYEAALGERVYLVEHEPDTRKLGGPDIAVSDAETRGVSPAAAATATLEPVTIPVAILDGPRETYIEILHQPERRLVTALELLSPANKEQPGRADYLAKRRALLRQDVHLIELDLLLTGQRMPLEQPLPAADYYYLLFRSDHRPNCHVYRWHLPEPLPVLPVPLRPPDPDIFINLAAVFATAYERGRFFRRLPYAAGLPAFVPGKQRAWADAVLRKLEK